MNLICLNMLKYVWNTNFIIWIFLKKLSILFKFKTLWMIFMLFGSFIYSRVFCEPSRVQAVSEKSWCVFCVYSCVFCICSWKKPRLSWPVWGQSVRNTRTRSASLRSRWASSTNNTNTCQTGPKWWVSGTVSKLCLLAIDVMIHTVLENP